ncbi:suppressor of fused domain protein [Pseudomonas parafulva]|uniref:Suppressor of fused domain protein n=1 Tax=Pseudomonas parafulva TaxID=157782 RepID=A0AAI8KA19_9PSED|nr:suppressor of fused domain protein [Pseudomonas parafulva]AXO87792.1 suppressor of fused domain protein [Pseudomonas parafulva]
MNLISHMESTLGQIEQGWSYKDGASPVKIVRFRDKPFDGVMTYVTLGLSDFLLSMPQGREVRQELVFTTYETFSAEAVSSFMLSFCDYILAHKQALLRGDVVGPSVSLISGVAVNSVYASIPVIFDEDFSIYRDSSPHTVMVWLIPLLQEEANFVKFNGWSQFEDLLERENPDLMELNRDSNV